MVRFKCRPAFLLKNKLLQLVLVALVQLQNSLILQLFPVVNSAFVVFVRDVLATLFDLSLVSDNLSGLL